MSGSGGILVTGAGGFVGRELVARIARDAPVIAASRRTMPASPAVRQHHVGDIHGETEWDAALAGCRVVVHLAARVHVMQETSPDPRTAFMRTNVDGTRRLAEQAAKAGVRRFVFVSTIGVCGAASDRGKPIGPHSPVAPHDAYSESKVAAEDALRRVCASSGMDWTIVRPPMVYGRDAPGNFAAMLRVLRRRIPLPLALVDNRRSLVAVDNLVDLLAHAITHPSASGRNLTVTDGEDLSTTALLERTARAMGLPGARLFPFPQRALWSALRCLGRERVALRLLGNLEIDTTETRSVLGWRPVIGVDEALRRAVA